MTQKKKQKTNRDKFLNIIYFIDSNKTKTLKLSLVHSYIALGVLAATVLWAIVGTGLLISSYSTEDQNRTRIRSLLSTIFTYQTRYDEIYERTYTPSAIPKRIAGLDDEPTKSPEPKKADTKVSLAAKPSIDPSLVPDPKLVVPEKIDPKKPVPTVPKPEVKESVLVNRFRISKQGNSRLALRVAIRNQNRPERANGYIIGFARFIGLDGKTTIISSPPGLSESDAIVASKLPANHQFSIRYYTKKTLVFDLPDKNGGTFESIKVVVGGKENERLDFMYNVKGTQGTFSPSPEAKNKSDQSTNGDDAQTAPKTAVLKNTLTEEDDEKGEPGVEDRDEEAVE